MFAQLGKLSDRAVYETASAEPDIKAIIAERVEAGEIFTAKCNMVLLLPNFAAA
jgi:hypothetical protein